ncbi:MAG: metallophosphoesterase [Chitinispirillaceae bacterium]|nr:metallophosphoesterase [Chitinispirillaceae bacterium]
MPLCRSLVCRFLCSALPFLFACGVRSQVGHPQGVEFAFSSDIHFGCNDGEDLLASHIDTWRSQLASLDFLVVAGDLTCNGMEKEFITLRGYLRRLTKKVYTLPGNHDLGHTDVGDDRLYKKHFGRGTGSFYIEHRDIGFLFLDLSEGGRATVTVRDPCTVWLAQRMKKVSNTTPIVVFSHYPLHPETPRYAVQKSDVLFAILDQKNVIGYFSGHYHGWWTGQRNGVPFYTVGSLMPSTKNFDGSDRHGYYTVTVMGSELGVEYVALIASKTTGY